jgi:hypothetical protein
MRNFASAVVLFVSLCGSTLADDEPATLFEQMKQLSKETVVRVETEKGKQTAELITTPIFRYTDQPRHIVDASLWAWIHHDRLVAFQKIEALALPNEPLHWQYCFASFSSQHLDSNGLLPIDFKPKLRVSSFTIFPAHRYLQKRSLFAHNK